MSRNPRCELPGFPQRVVQRGTIVPRASFPPAMSDALAEVGSAKRNTVQWTEAAEYLRCTGIRDTGFAGGYLYCFEQ